MSCLKTKTTDIKLEAMKVLWGIAQCREVTVDVSGNPDGKFLPLNLIQENYEQLLGYIWFEDAGVDPEPAGKTLLASVPYEDGVDSAEDLASAIKTALEASAYADLLDITVTGAVVHVANKIFGLVDTEGAGDSGFTVEVQKEGLGGDLGKTEQGGITFNMETQTFELKSDQTAEQLLGEINLGNSTTIEMTLIEMTKARFKTLLGSVVGDVYDLGGGEEMIGIGTSKLFKELSALGGRMVLHPLRISDVTDRSEDWSFHLTSPLPNSLNFSGTEQQGLEITFKPYVDESKPAEISVGGLGDWLALLNL